VQAEDCNLSSMADVVENSCPQKFQHFISNSPWEEDRVLDQIAKDADRLLGGTPASALLIDETSFPKQGKASVGCARQWCGRLGKVENCQVAVLGVLTNGTHYTPVDKRLYLPQEWVADPARCNAAGVPDEARILISKSEHALQIVRDARAKGVRFEWVGADAGYGKEPAFLRKLNADGEIFMVDVHSTQRVFINKPDVNNPKKTSSISVRDLIKSFDQSDWSRFVLRDSTRGLLEVDIAHRYLWVWDGKEEEPHHWHLIIRREVESPETIKYSLSNSQSDTPVLKLAQMQGNRYWIERSLQDGKSECGLADYQVRGWLAWNHHVTMVMLAMLFIAEQRVRYQLEHSEYSPILEGVQVLEDIEGNQPIDKVQEPVQEVIQELKQIPESEPELENQQLSCKQNSQLKHITQKDFNEIDMLTKDVTQSKPIEKIEYPIDKAISEKPKALSSQPILMDSLALDNRNENNELATDDRAKPSVEKSSASTDKGIPKQSIPYQSNTPKVNFFDLLSARDIVDMLKEMLPRKPEGKEAIVKRINQRHKQRRNTYKKCGKHGFAWGV
jgi:SRSO17 transposase